MTEGTWTVEKDYWRRDGSTRYRLETPAPEAQAMPCSICVTPLQASEVTVAASAVAPYGTTTNYSTVYLGRDTGESNAQHLLIRFQNVGIPFGAVVVQAKLLYRRGASGSPATASVYFEDTDDAPSFDVNLTGDGYGNRNTQVGAMTRTDEQTETLPAGSDSTDQEIPLDELSTVLARTGWASGNDINLMVEATGGASFWESTWSTSGGQEPRLVVTFLEP